MFALVVLVLSIIGAVADWQYVRAGGKKSARRERLLFFGIVLIVIAAIAITEFVGADPYGILGFTIVPLFVCLFGAWELGRWRTRLKNPLQPKEAAVPNQ